MKSITITQAEKIMDIIAERSCNLVGYAMALGDFNNEKLGDVVNEKTRQTFCEICDILNITSIEVEED